MMWWNTTASMKILISPDSFKGSLTAPQAAAAIAAGLRRSMPGAELMELPVADGGEGTAEAIALAVGAVRHDVRVTDPLGRPVIAPYYMMADGTAIMDLAAASGLTLVDPGLRNPLKTDTYGTGLLMRAAAEAGARRIVIGLGGSATVDGGAGLLRALRGIDLCPVIAACDVETPMSRAAEIYGPQKGATPEMVSQLRTRLARLAELYGDRDEPRGGAAGGVGAALRSVLGATLVSGIEIVLRTIGFHEKASGADVVITGEGRMDAQTLQGKAPAGVLQAARRAGVHRVIGLCGQVRDRAALIAAGFDTIIPIDTPGPGAADALRAAATRLIC